MSNKWKPIELPGSRLKVLCHAISTWKCIGNYVTSWLLQIKWLTSYNEYFTQNHPLLLCFCVKFTIFGLYLSFFSCFLLIIPLPHCCSYYGNKLFLNICWIKLRFPGLNVNNMLSLRTFSQKKNLSGLLWVLRALLIWQC